MNSTTMLSGAIGRVALWVGLTLAVAACGDGSSGAGGQGGSGAGAAGDGGTGASTTSTTSGMGASGGTGATTAMGGNGGTGGQAGTCGDGKVDAGESCDTAIAAGEQGACPTVCNDGLLCTQDVLVGAGTCAAECVLTEVTACTNGDGCCPANCAADTDCAALSRIKQSVITEAGASTWYRNGYWNGTGYSNWTVWNGQALTQIVPQLGTGQTYRGIDHVILGDGRVKITLLEMNGSKAWSRYGKWDGSGYSDWTDWSDQFGNLATIVPGQGSNQSYRSFDHVVFPNGTIKQTLLTSDGKKLWYRSSPWNGTGYTDWTAWSDVGGDLTQLIEGQGNAQSFRSFNQVVFVDKRMKQAALTEDGSTVWVRYATWDGNAYVNWTAWSNQYGNFSSLLPGQGNMQKFLGFDEGSLAGGGSSSGCQNGCDDGDPCTVDSCVSNSCQHAAITCDDGSECTTDVCISGVCQNSPNGCDDGNPCTDDACSGASCSHNQKNCDDGNPCTDDSCSGGACQWNNNSAPCGNGSTCQNGSCPEACSCNVCDACGEACNPGGVCAPNATCQGTVCACVNGQGLCGGKCCANGETCAGGGCCPTGQACGSKCCGAGDSCSGGNCCPTAQSAFCDGKCGTVSGPCGPVNCGQCGAGLQCCSGLCDIACL